MCSNLTLSSSKLFYNSNCLPILIRHLLSPVFRITAQAGPEIMRSRLCPALSVPLSLEFAENQLTTVSSDLVTHGRTLQEALEAGPGTFQRFPTLAMLHCNVLRGNPKMVNDWTIQTTAISWSLRTSVPEAESSGPSTPQQHGEAPLPIAQRPGPRFVYQGGNNPYRSPTRAGGRLRQVPIYLQQDEPHPQAEMEVYQLGRQVQIRAQLTDEEYTQHDANAYFTTERFFPLQPLHYARGLPPDSTTSISPDHLRGLWVGTFGPHGQEYGYINARECETVAFHADEVDLEQMTPDPGQLQPNLQRGSSRSKRFVLEYVKITGDTNVPAGSYMLFASSQSLCLIFL